MTIAQIIACCIAGPVALMALARLIMAFFSKNVDFHIFQAFLLIVSVVAILVTFLGIQ